MEQQDLKRNLLRAGDITRGKIVTVADRKITVLAANGQECILTRIPRDKGCKLKPGMDIEGFVAEFSLTTPVLTLSNCFLLNYPLYQLGKIKKVRCDRILVKLCCDKDVVCFFHPQWLKPSFRKLPVGQDVKVSGFKFLNGFLYVSRLEPCALAPAEQVRERYQPYEMNGFTFNRRNDYVYHIGRAKKSLIKFRGWWLGFMYRIFVRYGKPYFSIQPRFEGKLRTVIDNPADLKYEDGDLVYILITYIRNDDKGILIKADVKYVEKSSTGTKAKIVK